MLKLRPDLSFITNFFTQFCIKISYMTPANLNLQSNMQLLLVQKAEQKYNIAS